MQRDAEGDQLAAIGVEAAREGLVGHLGVALDRRFDLAGGQRPPLRHEEGDQGELPDQLVGVVRQGSYSFSAVSLVVAHLDLDAFFAAVEELEHPELADRPLVVGGDPQGRGVVATANYYARRYGIHSAMSCAEALRRCPHAVFVRPDHRLYSERSRAVWRAVREVVPTVERTGLDEGYLDFGEVLKDFHGARPLAEAVQVAVRGATKLSCSLGVGTCKVVAKVASDRRKPGGITVVPPGREAAFLAPFPVRLLPGVGPRAEERLRASGVETIGALAALEDGELSRLVPGKVGRLLRDRARGIDPRPLELASETVSIGHEETFERDVSDRERLHGELRRMAVRVADRLVTTGQAARTVTTKIRYPDFSIRSRSTTLPVGCADGAKIGELACLLLDRALVDRPSPATSGGRERVEPRAVRAAGARGLTRYSSGRGCFQVLVRRAVLAVGKRRPLARLALPRRGATARHSPVERARLDLLLDELDRRADAFRHRPGDLRLVRDGEVAADVLKQRPVGVREVARVLGQPLDRLLAGREDGAAVLELFLDVGVRIDEILDRPVNGPGILIHAGEKVFLELLRHSVVPGPAKCLQMRVNIGLRSDLGSAGARSLTRPSSVTKLPPGSRSQTFRELSRRSGGRRRARSQRCGLGAPRSRPRPPCRRCR